MSESFNASLLRNLPIRCLWPFVSQSFLQSFETRCCTNSRGATLDILPLGCFYLLWVVRTSSCCSTNASQRACLGWRRFICMSSTSVVSFTTLQGKHLRLKASVSSPLLNCQVFTSWWSFYELWLSEYVFHLARGSGTWSGITCVTGGLFP